MPDFASTRVLRLPAVVYAGLFFGLFFGFLIAGALLNLPGALVPDEFAYLFSAKIFLTGRLAAPSPPSPEHFESLYVLASPSWASRYPPLQSVVLAIGLVLGHPLMGVWASCAAWGAALWWALRPVVTPVVSAVVLWLWFLFFSCGHYWAFSLWGGGAAAGCGTLLLGASWRLSESWSSRIAAVWVLAVLGLSISRPLEGCLLTAMVWFLLGIATPMRGVGRRRWLGLALVAGVVAVMVNGVYNHAVTGRAWVFPYSLWESQYARVPLFVWQEQEAPPGTGPLVVQAVRSGVLDGRSLGESWWMGWSRLYADFREITGLVLLFCSLVLAPVFVRRIPVRLWLCVLSLPLIALLHFACVPYFPHYAAPFAGVLWVLMAWPLAEAKARIKPGLFAAGVLTLTMVMLWVYAPRDGAPHRIANNVPESALMTRLSVAAAQVREPLIFFVQVPEIRPSQAVFCGLYNEPELDAAHALYVWDLGTARNAELLRLFPRRRALYVRLTFDAAGAWSLDVRGSD